MNHTIKIAKITSAIALALTIAGPAMASWTSDALNHQYRLQKHEPIVQGLIAGTHNSYSSNAYNLHLYENQNLSITDQLNAGARFLEFDMYRTRDVEYGGIYLCHNGGRCTGNFTFGDYVYLDSALREIATWTKANPDQILVIKVENGNMKNEDFAVMEEGISLQIGDIVYRPERSADSDGCKAFPATLTPAQMLEQGKQVLFYGYVGCDTSSSAAASVAVSNKWIFENTNNELDDDSISTMRSAAQSCSRHSENAFSLYYEGREEVADIKTGNPIPTDVITDLLKCGGTAFGFDWLTADDSRLKAAIWSWAPNQPDNLPGVGGNGQVECAVSYQNHLYDDSCSLPFNYACENSQGEWQIAQTQGAWDAGNSACQSEFGGDYRFSVPKTSKQNEALRKVNTTNANFWVNYHKGKNDNWLSGQDMIEAAKLVDKSHLLTVAVTTDHQFMFSDAGEGTGLNIGIYRNILPSSSWYMLGDTPAFAADGPYASGYSRTPGRSMIVFDDGSNKLADPIRYDWRWNDWKTGGDYDVTFWHPVAPAGYTCLGDVVRGSHDRTQPVLPIKCVRDDLLLDGQAHYFWNDSGSGGEYDATAYLTVVPVSSTVNQGMPANTLRLSGGTAHKVLNYTKINLVNGPKSFINSEYSEIKALGKCIEPESDHFADGTNVRLWDCNNGARQQWSYEPTSGYIRNKHNPAYCLDSTGATGNFDSVTIYSCIDHINLKWTWHGSRIKPQVNPQLSLDVYLANPANGTDIIQYQDNNTVAQIFTKGL